VHEKVVVILNPEALTIDIRLMRGPQYYDEHNMTLDNLALYRGMEEEIMSSIQRKGFVLDE
jgi:hypothetical protein